MQMEAYHGSDSPDLWIGAGLFITADYETAVGYATERSYLGDTGWVHTIELTGLIADPDDLGIEISDVNDLYNRDILEAAHQAGYVAIRIDETHHVIDYRTTTTLVLVDPTAAVGIGSFEIAPDEEGLFVDEEAEM